MPRSVRCRRQAAAGQAFSRRLRRRTQIDAQGEDAVLDLGHGITDHGEVHEVGLRLLSEALTLRALDRWEPSLSHGLGPGAETLDHGLWIELIRHPDDGTEVRAR